MSVNIGRMPKAAPAKESAVKELSNFGCGALLTAFRCVSPQDCINRFNRNRKVFCSILTNRCCSAIGPVLDADTIVLYDTDLNPSVDAHTQEWCDKIGRSKDIHIYRCCFGNTSPPPHHPPSQYT